MKRVLILILLACVLPLGAKVIDPDAQFGSRKNPVPFQEWIELENNTKIVQMTITNVMSGEDSWKAVKTFNPLAYRLPEGEEYLIVGIQAAYKEDKSGTDASWSIDKFDFSLADSGYTISDRYDTILMGGYDIGATLYEGGETVGVVPFVSSDGTYLVYDRTIWFELSPR